MHHLDLVFSQLKITPSDINEHLETLKILSSECDSVVELGVRSGVSTHALIIGKPRQLKSFDINPIGIIEKTLNTHALDRDVNWQFYNENCLTTNNIDTCDMIFIDTYHDFKQMSCELFLHGNKATKYLVFHDTVTFGNHNELGELRGESLPSNLQDFFYSLPDSQGIMPAIEHFMSLNPHWKIHQHYLNNNGLLVLTRNK
jgi:hypothetical protein